MQAATHTVARNAALPHDARESRSSGSLSHSQSARLVPPVALAVGVSARGSMAAAVDCALWLLFPEVARVLGPIVARRHGLQRQHRTRRLVRRRPQAFGR